MYNCYLYNKCCLITKFSTAIPAIYLSALLFFWMLPAPYSAPVLSVSVHLTDRYDRRHRLYRSNKRKIQAQSCSGSYDIIYVLSFQPAPYSSTYMLKTFFKFYHIAGINSSFLFLLPYPSEAPPHFGNPSISPLFRAAYSAAHRSPEAKVPFQPVSYTSSTH